MTITYHLNEIDEAARNVLSFFPAAAVFTFAGPLGAGKTTLIRAICRQLGVPAAAISSPTFSIINEYLPQANNSYQRISHMDWYRLQSLEEACQAGVEDALQQEGTLCLIEWPQQVPQLLSMPYVELDISKSAEQEERTVQITLKRP